MIIHSKSNTKTVMITTQRFIKSHQVISERLILEHLLKQQSLVEEETQTLKCQLCELVNDIAVGSHKSKGNALKYAGWIAET
jgi:hypothetical protein